MAHKVHPKSFRLGTISNWRSLWFNRKKYKEFLKQDYELREFLMKKLKQAAINDIEIKRSANLIQIKIHSARPGIIIGRGGTGINDLKREIIRKIFKGRTNGIDIKLDIEEVKKPEIHAQIVAQNIAEQLERRMPFRSVMKRAIEKVMQNPEVKGVKMQQGLVIK